MKGKRETIKRKLKNVAKKFIKKKPEGDYSINPMFPKAGITKDPARRYKNGGCAKHR